MIWKFVSWPVPPLDTLKGSFAYRMHEKLEHGIPLTREEKNDLFAATHLDSYSTHTIALGGYRFDFGPWLRRFWVQIPYYGIQEYYAADKTAIRRCPDLRGLREIHEVLPKGRSLQ